MGKEGISSEQQPSGRNWGEWFLHTFFSGRGKDPNSTTMTRREFLQFGVKALGAGAVAGVLSSCGISPDGSQYSSSSEQSNERFRLSDPGKVAFAAALSGDPIPPKLLEKIMHQGLESGGSFQAILGSLDGSQESLTLELMKGKSFPPSKQNASYLVMCDREGGRWFKVAPTDNMVPRLIQGKNALEEELSLMRYELPNGIARPSVKTITINGSTLTAVETPYWGPTVASMINTAEAGEIRALYQDAFYTATKLLVERGITVRDPNPGNIAKLTLKNGKTVGFVFDFESSGSAVVSPTEEAMKSLIARFAKWNERLGLNMDLSLHPDIAKGVIPRKQGMVIGRVFSPDRILIMNILLLG